MNRASFAGIVVALLAAGPAVAAPGAPASAGTATSARSEQAITARSAVARALGGNASLRSTELEVAQARQNVVAEEGRYPYVFQADAAHNRSTVPRLSPDGSVSSNSSRSYAVGSAIRRQFPMGTTAELRVEGQRYETDPFAQSSVRAPLGAGYAVSVRGSVTQPLLRGAGTTIGEAELRAARVNQKLAQRTQRRASSELVRDVLQAYSELWYAGQVAEIERAALTLAQRQLTEAEQRVQQGALPRADVLPFATRVAELQEAVVSAELAERQRSLELAVLMGATDLDSSAPWRAAEAPPNLPGPTRADLEQALRSNSLELLELEAQAELARTRARVAGDNSRPRLDLEGYLESQGVGTDVPSAGERAVGMQWISAHVGAVFELPLDDSRRQAEKAAAELGVRIAEQNLKAARDRLAAEAARLVAEEQAARVRLELAESTARLAEQSYEAERARFELGSGLSIQVQEAEDNWRRARLRVARARVDAAEARIFAQHVSDGLLARYAGGTSTPSGG